jgi:hypothetical protein
MRRQQKSCELDTKKLVERVERLEQKLRSRGGSVQLLNSVYPIALESAWFQPLNP